MFIKVITAYNCYHSSPLLLLLWITSYNFSTYVNTLLFALCYFHFILFDVLFVIYIFFLCDFVNTSNYLFSLLCLLWSYNSHITCGF